MRATARRVAADPQPLKNAGLLAAISSILLVPGIGWLAVGYAVSNMMFACLPTWAPG